MKNVLKFLTKHLMLIICILICLIIAAIPIGFYITYFHNQDISNNGEYWGQFGDFFGGTLNPIFALFSFLALLYTIKQQIDQLEHSREELQLTREELTRSADAQDASKTIMEEQLKTQSAQQFDSIFFAMLRELNTLLAKLEEIPPKYRINNNYGHGDQISALDKIHQKIFTKDLSSIHEIQTQLLQEKDIAQYFMLLYQLLKIIDTKIIKQPNETSGIKQEHKKIKKMYSNIVRASISEKTMQLLIVNVSCPGFEKYRKLVEQFAFFEHVSFKVENNVSYNLLLINLVAQLNKQAFGHSLYFKSLQDRILFSKFVPNHKILNTPYLYKQVFLNLNGNNDFKVNTIHNKIVHLFSKYINGREYNIFLDRNNFMPVFYQNPDHENQWSCHSSITDNDIKIYSGNDSSRQNKLLYTIKFEKDGEVTIQYEKQS